MITIELMREGWLVKGATTKQEAQEALRSEYGDTMFPLVNICSYRPGRYRKVPARWGPWNLYDGTGPGSFQAVTVTLPPGAWHPISEAR